MTGSLAAKLQPASVTIDINGCTNALTCGAEFLVGETITFSGSLMAGGAPVEGATINIVRLTPAPELITIASTETGEDGTYEVTWNAELLPGTAVDGSATKKILAESAVFYAQFEGSDELAPARTNKLIVTISANQITANVNASKRVYAEGDGALISIALIDSRGRFTDPDSLRVIFDGVDMKAEKKKAGSYTFRTPELTVDHHQLVVIPKKDGYNPGTGYLTVQVAGFFGK